MSVCGGWSLVRQDTTGTRAITLWCRAWSCADCAPHRLNGLKRLARSGRPTTFLTLTVNPATGQSPEGRARELVEAARTMLKRARRRFRQKTIDYLAVFEETKKGEPHLHMLMRAPFIPQKWISAQMDELIKAPIVDIRRVTSARAAAQYVAKYVAKGPKSFGSLKRYWCTPKYDLERLPTEQRDEYSDSGWRVVQEPLFILAESIQSLLRIVEWVSDHEWFAPNGVAWRSSA